MEWDEKKNYTKESTKKNSDDFFFMQKAIMLFYS